MFRQIAFLATSALVASVVAQFAIPAANAEILDKQNSQMLIAQASSQDVTVKVTNISGLQRIVAGGHSAKVAYNVNVPTGFAVKNVKIKVTFKLRDGQTQTGEAQSNNAISIVEVRAPGRVIRADEEVDKITATATATIQKNFNGFIQAKAPANNLSALEKTPGDASQFPLSVDVTKISNLDRKVGGGHKMDVTYKVNNIPSGFSFTQVLVKGRFLLDNGDSQVNTTELNNPRATDTATINATGNVGQDGEVRNVHAEVTVKGKITKGGEGTLTESASQASN